MLKEAIKSYQIVVEGNSEFSEAWFNLGSAYKELNKNEAAIASFKKAIVIKPDFIEALNELGNLHSDLGVKDALNYFVYA